MTAAARALGIKALTFDTFGTLVDWRGTILDEVRALGTAKNRDADWHRFVADWKAYYRPGMDKVNRGEWPWTRIEEIYRRGLTATLEAHGLTQLTDDEIEHLNHVWWRLRPWPDTVPGLVRLRKRYVIAPLSNASFAGMVHLSKFAGLPWDCVITAENARCYKPRAEVYRLPMDLLALRPDEVMMVAAHNYDLGAARTNGMRTAFIARPTEYGPGQTTDLAPESDWDVVAKSVEDLAAALGA